MGSVNAAGAAEAVREGYVGLRTALHYHLRSNHYPPLPVAYIDVAIDVIEALRGEPSEDADIVVPPIEEVGVSPRESWVDDDGVTRCSAFVLCDILHLADFI